MRTKTESEINEMICKAHISFKLTVPANYVHDTQLDSFRKQLYKKGMWFGRFTEYNNKFNTDISDQNFNSTSDKLEPGKTYLVELFPIRELNKNTGSFINDYKYTGLTSNECLSFLEKNGSLLVSAQGLSLLWQLAVNECPFGKLLVSFDKKINLFVGVPYLEFRSGLRFVDYQEYKFSHHPYEDFSEDCCWGSGVYVVSFKNT